MTTPVKKRNASKFCEFHGEVEHNTDECMHLRKQIEEIIKAGKLSHLIKELKQENGKEQPKATKKGETSGKDKALAILMDEGIEGSMIIKAEIGGHCIHRMYVDGGSASEILYELCFSRLRPKIKKHLVSATTHLIGFSGEIIWAIGQIHLLVTIGDEEHSASAWMNFVVARSPSPYNRIIGRPGVKKLYAVPSTTHGMLNILVTKGVITLKSSRLVPLECAMVSGPEGTLPAINPIVEERIKHNLDILAWKPADITGVPRYITEHRLNIREGCSLVRQKKRGQATDRNQAIQEEVGKLMEAGIMREVHYHDWLSNPVMTTEAEEAFRQMKQLIAELRMLTAPMEKEELIVYLAAAKEAVSAVLMMEREAKQMPIYFVSKALRGPELNYTSMEKLVMALIHAIKRPEVDSPDTLMDEEGELPEPWILFTDGSSCTDRSGAGLILTNPEGMEFIYALRFRFDATNNEAEYEALITGLRIAEQMGVKNL
ncbi:reverse transcriptase domain-containing protein [Tanacetum coccineum]